MKTFLGIDIGGTEIKYGIFTEEGKQLVSDVKPTKKEKLEDFIACLAEIVVQYPEVEGIAFSVPGFINVHTGHVINGGAIEVLDGYNLKTLLSAYTTLPMAFENDANCVALAEKWQGNAQNYSNFLTLTIGTGVGGGIMLNNQLFRGSNFMAGEFGYMFVDGLGKEDPRDTELSELGSTRGLVKRVEQALQVEAGTMNGRMVFEALEQGNEVVKAVYDGFIDALASGLFNLIYCFNPEAILIGGGVSAQPRVLEDIKTKIHAIYKPTLQTVILDVCKFRNDSGKVGAVYHFMQQEMERREMERRDAPVSR